MLEIPGRTGPFADGCTGYPELRARADEDSRPVPDGRSMELPPPGAEMRIAEGTAENTTGRDHPPGHGDRGMIGAGSGTARPGRRPPRGERE